MHITVAGKLGSGKSTICRILKEKHGFQVYSTGAIHREIAQQRNITTHEMNEMLKDQNQDFDKEIDDAVTQISVEQNGKTIVFDSRMAWKFAVGSFKVFCIVDTALAAQRIFDNPRGDVETYLDVNDAKEKLFERGMMENERFMKLYDVDTFDYANYNLVLDTSALTAEAAADIIFEKFTAFCKGGSEQCEILLSPTSLYPLDDISSINIYIVEENRVSREYLHQPINIIIHDNYHFITDGHHRMLAAILNGESLVRVKAVDTDEYLVMLNLQTLTLSSVQEFEEAGNFRYGSYPQQYSQN
ncbi:MAG: cytidylate kinase family protein [Defluviitaleaceae bacterium]|nr:cytidylate kinase family protein [Defluviitaleaceae bacterium]